MTTNGKISRMQRYINKCVLEKEHLKNPKYSIRTHFKIKKKNNNENPICKNIFESKGA